MQSKKSFALAVGLMPSPAQSHSGEPLRAAVSASAGIREFLFGMDVSCDFEFSCWFRPPLLPTKAPAVAAVYSPH